MEDTIPRGARVCISLLNQGKRYLYCKRLGGGRAGEAHLVFADSKRESGQRSPYVCKITRLHNRSELASRATDENITIPEQPPEINYPPTKNNYAPTVHSYQKLKEDEYGIPRFSIIQDFCNGGTLDELMLAWWRRWPKSPFPERFVWKVIEKLVRGLRYMHCRSALRFVHHDLHRGNIFINYSDPNTSENRMHSQIKVMLGDFGTAGHLTHCTIEDDKILAMRSAATSHSPAFYHLGLSNCPWNDVNGVYGVLSDLICEWAVFPWGRNANNGMQPAGQIRYECRRLGYSDALADVVEEFGVEPFSFHADLEQRGHRALESGTASHEETVSAGLLDFYNEIIEIARSQFNRLTNEEIEKDTLAENKRRFRIIQPSVAEPIIYLRTEIKRLFRQKNSRVYDPTGPLWQDIKALGDAAEVQLVYVHPTTLEIYGPVNLATLPESYHVPPELLQDQLNLSEWVWDQADMTSRLRSEGIDVLSDDDDGNVAPIGSRSQGPKIAWQHLEAKLPETSTTEGRHTNTRHVSEAGATDHRNMKKSRGRSAVDQPKAGDLGGVSPSFRSMIGSKDQSQKEEGHGNGSKSRNKRKSTSAGQMQQRKRRRTG
ncbi:MAG: hypothetical protein Q9227_004769 [Pyrenula ochraceoflavens]